MPRSEDSSSGFSVFGTGGFMDSSDSNRAIYLGGWSPGIDPLRLPPGHGVPIEGRSGDAVFEIHYRPTGKPTSDRSRIGLYFAKDPVTNIVASTVAGTVDVNIAPEDKNYWRQVYMDVPSDIRLIGVSPHMHYLGREVRAVANLPGGEEIPLLNITDWNFRWQNVYMLREPISLPAGTRINAWFRFDNSSDNPANPHVRPARSGGAGPRTRRCASYGCGSRRTIPERSGASNSSETCRGAVRPGFRDRRRMNSARQFRRLLGRSRPAETRAP